MADVDTGDKIDVSVTFFFGKNPAASFECTAIHFRIRDSPFIRIRRGEFSSNNYHNHHQPLTLIPLSPFLSTLFLSMILLRLLTHTRSV